MSYTATLSREDGMWLGEVTGLPGAHAYARTLARLRDELADAIILADDLPDDADVEIAFEIDEDPLLAQAFKVAERRLYIRKYEKAVFDETAEAVRSLIAAGWSVRDTAGALDITAGRVSQLAKSP